MTAIPFTTDQALVVVFDPAVLRHRVREPRGWWRLPDLLDLPEVEGRRAAIWPIGREGSFRVALRVAEDLQPAEAERAVDAVSGLGVVVESGQVFVGSGDRLPGGGGGDRMPHIPDTGAVLDVPPGEYTAELHLLRWREDDAFFDEDGEVVKDAPADFVILLKTPQPDDEPPARLPDLLDLMPKAEAKGRAKVGLVPRRRRSEPEPVRGRRRRSGGAAPSLGEGGTTPRAPRSVPSEMAAYHPEQVRDAFREVLYEHVLHPPEDLGLASIAFRPRDRTLLAHDIAMDVLYKKLTRVREQLRMLEAKVNRDGPLDLADKVELQGPITGVYLAVDGLLDALGDEWARAAAGR